MPGIILWHWALAMLVAHNIAPHPPQWPISRARSPGVAVCECSQMQPELRELRGAFLQRASNRCRPVHAAQGGRAPPSPPPPHHPLHQSPSSTSRPSLSSSTSASTSLPRAPSFSSGRQTHRAASPPPSQELSASFAARSRSASYAPLMHASSTPPSPHYAS